MESAEYTNAGQNYSSDFKKIMDAAGEINPLFRQLVQEVIITHNTVLEILLFIAGLKENTVLTRDQLASCPDLLKKMSVPSINTAMIQSVLSGNKEHIVDLSGSGNADRPQLIEQIKNSGWNVDVVTDKDRDFKVKVT